MTRPRVLVEATSLRSFHRILAGRFDVVLAGDGARALDLGLTADFDVLVSDVRAAGADGLALFRELKRVKPDLEVVLVATKGAGPSAGEAMKEGAYDCLREPFEADEVVLTIERAAERKFLRGQARVLAARLARAGELDHLIGKSAAMQHVFEAIARASGSGLPVLIMGERGTGKELAARAIHGGSARATGPFVPVECGSISELRIDAELFGHARGAFIGAETEHRGLFEQAAGGTLYLAEVGALPPATQARLARALQRRTILRVGELVERDVCTRIIAATTEDPAPALLSGKFCEELYYLLHVSPIRLPPLRERSADIPALAHALLARHAGEYGRHADGFTRDALAALTRHGWPGNVRELENAMERALAVMDGSRIGLDALPAEVAFGESPRSDTELGRLAYREALEGARERASRHYLTALMREHDGSVTRAADTAGVERETLHRLLKRHGLRSDEFRRRDSG